MNDIYLYITTREIFLLKKSRELPTRFCRVLFQLNQVVIVGIKGLHGESKTNVKKVISSRIELETKLKIPKLVLATLLKSGENQTGILFPPELTFFA